MIELEDAEGCPECGAIAGCCNKYPNCPANPDWKEPENQESIPLPKQ